jgi:catechol 2,3-dioxygenase-like lactoylglutathione lyase family enzyme
MMKRQILTLALLLAFMYSCEQRDFVRESGQIESFAEMVKSGVKPLALSPPMTSAELDLFMPEVERISKKYGIEFFREESLVQTDLFPVSIAEGKEVVLFYKGNTLNAYQDLKQEFFKENLSAPQKRDLSRRFGRLLGYPTDRINDLLAENSAFRDLEDFGIQSLEVRWFYRDLAKAKDFYQTVLGLELVEETENTAKFLIAGDSFLTLQALANSGYSGKEPKSVALAFLTEQLENWYAHLQEQKVTIKYPLKQNPGGPHDGFVAVDPEGYLLEFETFFQHPENEVLIPELSELQAKSTRHGEKLQFTGSVVWLYYKDMLPAELFVEESLGLTKSADQGWAKVYKLSQNGYLGLVDGLRGMNTFSLEKLVEINVDLENPGPWENYLKANSQDSTRKANSFKDAGGYLFRF